jgi:HAD superfamily hydrolase (TIGR01490 family)
LNPKKALNPKKRGLPTETRWLSGQFMQNSSLPAPLADPIAEIGESPSGPQVGAFFDVDGTLVAGITATSHASDRIRRGQAGLGEVFGVLEASLRYRFGRVQFARLLTRAAGYLRGALISDLDALGDQLFVDHVASRVYPAMREIVSAHQSRGHTVVLSSSAMTIHAEPVARFLGIDHVLCNHFELDGNGALTGAIVRPVIWGPQKAVAVTQFCAANDVELQQSYFYADGDEDAALMTLVGHPRPVNPRSRLAALAAQRNWPVMRITPIASRGGAAGSFRRAAALGWAMLLRLIVGGPVARLRPRDMR